MIARILKILMDYPGARRGSLLLVMCTLLWDGAVAQVHLTRLDTMLAQSLPMIIEQSGHFEPILFRGDSSLGPLLDLIPNPVGSQASTFYIQYLDPTITNRDGSNAKLSVEVRGVFLSPDKRISSKFAVTKVVDITLSDSDRAGLDRHESAYLERIYDSYVSQSVHAEPVSFWSSTLEPALVVIGAVAIVALFFLVRS